VASRDGRTFLLRRAQDELRYREAGKQAAMLNEMRVLFDMVPAMIWFKNTENGFVRVNKRVAEMTGMRVGEIEGKSAYEIFPHEAAGYYADDLEVIRSGLPKLGIIEKLRDSRGEELWVQTDKVPVCDKDGKVTGLIAMVQDISERRRAETRFRRLVDSNVQSVFFWNTKGLITDANTAFLKLVSHTREDLEAGRINWVNLTPPEFAELDKRAMKEIAATGICATFEKEFIRKDGARVPILVGAAVFEDNPDEGVCFVLDLTERKKLEHQFRQAQKMDGIGQLAGGVAHDFNNILAVILMQAGLMKMEGELSPRQMDFASEIEKSAERAANLTRQLLLFSRKQALQPRELDLNDVVANITKMLHRIIGEDVQMQFKYSPQPLFIQADAGMMDQVLMNLTVNARDAMPKGGRLFIETSAVDLDELAAKQVEHGRPGAFVCVSVTDTGSGIPPEVLPRIFEPFFTTKDVGKGTGLGLATVFGIVQQHHGWIQVYSEVGHGTVFKVYLPRLTTAAGQKAGPALPAATGGHETILLVEDDLSLCICVSKMLSRLGYRILEAHTAAEAVDLWNRHRAEIGLLFTDIVMPGGMNGKELAQQLHAGNPLLKVVYTSGYTADLVDKDFPLQEGVNFLTKPYETHKLAQTVRSILDGN
jgi:PAS domain S-box-containing protein